MRRRLRHCRPRRWTPPSMPCRSQLPVGPTLRAGAALAEKATSVCADQRAICGPPLWQAGAQRTVAPPSGPAPAVPRPQPRQGWAPARRERLLTPIPRARAEAIAAGAAPLYPPQYYQGAPYQGYPPGYYPPPPPKKDGLPPVAWVGLGIAIAFGLSKLLDMGKAKQNELQQAMMQQMLKSMMARACCPTHCASGRCGLPPDR